MDAPFEFEVHPTYLHFKYPSGFVMSAESTVEAWITIGKLCEQYGRSKVLIEGTKPERQMDTMTAFESGRGLAENIVGASIAICLHDYEFDELSAFFKTVAQNRGVKMEFFSELDAALEWLGVKTGESAAGGN
jgi:hypothetical protein